MILDSRLENLRLTLANIYAPNDSPGFSLIVFQSLENMVNDLKILGGDLNLVLDLSEDKKGERYPTNTRAAEIVKTQMELDGLCDIWRQLHPTKKQYTWKRLKPSLIMMRLEFFLISDPLVQLVDTVGIAPGFLSDHSLISLSLVKSKVDRGPGFRTLNTSLLEQEEYVKIVEQEIKADKDQDYENESFRWEMIKMQIRAVSIKYATRKKRVMS